MMEQIIAKDLSVTCHDGSFHKNVTLKVCDGKRIYTDPDGRKLCVELVTAGTFNVSLTFYATVVRNCPMEVD
jgi:hypothetical protein